jgi:anthranilate phosphoribosyltransferase
VGAFDSRWVEPLARALGALGAKRAWVVHGDGLDEITTTGPTHIAEWREGGVRLFTVTPEAVGLTRAARSDLVGADPRSNAAALRSLLSGEKSAYRDIVLLNAAAAFLVAEQVETLKEGVAKAEQAIDQGAAAHALDALIEITSGR